MTFFARIYSRRGDQHLLSQSGGKPQATVQYTYFQLLNIQVRPSIDGQIWRLSEGLTVSTTLTADRQASPRNRSKLLACFERLSLSLTALKRQTHDRLRASPTVRAQPPTRGNIWRSLTLTARYALPPLLTGDFQVLRVPAPAPASSSYLKLFFAQRGCECGGGGSGGCAGQARGLRGAGESFASAERRRRNAPHGYGFTPGCICTPMTRYPDT
ncbi:hypothetical protein HETIRDRAFT_108000 [Heterobasidion irregulare TC 32-1]|uniref:Uncharacterized protein n=1 Tax=Heterobasidion irregulare (strain TC 32-1) TaxID=747525 RepID=W4JPN8_HETIT|nr:uncharacterized protein HETIRDRAFT_108000 [Heterobasidion irregulare TC 32-1]ETW75434.1 hypothetical protein HETIRDRAFT_108000 [Heterobasidion irregulare TC 32-1]